MDANWTEARLLDLIKDGARETFELEFKACDALGASDGKKRDISKDVSGMANAAGGTIIYGLKEADHVATEIDVGFDQNQISHEWLERVIASNIQPRLEGVRIHVVPLLSKTGRVAYVVTVPQAVNSAPHQANDKRYYKRANFEVRPMEDYEVRDVLRRARYPDLQLRWALVNEEVVLQGDNPVKITPFKLRAVVTNRSSEPALYSTIRAYFAEGLKVVHKSGYRSMGPERFATFSLQAWDRNFTAPNDFPFIKEQQSTAAEFHLAFENPLQSPQRFLIGSSLRAPGCLSEDMVSLVYRDRRLSIEEPEFSPSGEVL